MWSEKTGFFNSCERSDTRTNVESGKRSHPKVDFWRRQGVCESMGQGLKAKCIFTHCSVGVRLKCLKHKMARSELVVKKKRPTLLFWNCLDQLSFWNCPVRVSAVWDELFQTKSLHVHLGSELRKFVKSSKFVSHFCFSAWISSQGCLPGL